MSDKLSHEDKKLLEQMDTARAASDAPSARNSDGTLKAPEKAEQDSQDQVRQVGEPKGPASDKGEHGEDDKPRAGRRRKADKDGGEDEQHGERGPATPVQFDDDGWEGLPVQMRNTPQD